MSGEHHPASIDTANWDKPDGPPILEAPGSSETGAEHVESFDEQNETTLSVIDQPDLETLLNRGTEWGSAYSLEGLGVDGEVNSEPFEINAALGATRVFNQAVGAVAIDAPAAAERFGRLASSFTSVKNRVTEYLHKRQEESLNDFSKTIQAQSATIVDRSINLKGRGKDTEAIYRLEQAIATVNTAPGPLTARWLEKLHLSDSLSQRKKLAAKELVQAFKEGAPSIDFSPIHTAADAKASGDWAAYNQALEAYAEALQSKQSRGLLSEEHVVDAATKADAYINMVKVRENTTLQPVATPESPLVPDLKLLIHSAVAAADTAKAQGDRTAYQQALSDLSHHLELSKATGSMSEDEAGAIIQNIDDWLDLVKPGSESLTQTTLEAAQQEAEAAEETRLTIEATEKANFIHLTNPQTILDLRKNATEDIERILSREPNLTQSQQADVIRKVYESYLADHYGASETELDAEDSRVPQWVRDRVGDLLDMSMAELITEVREGNHKRGSKSFETIILNKQSSQEHKLKMEKETDNRLLEERVIRSLPAAPKVINKRTRSGNRIKPAVPTIRRNLDKSSAYPKKKAA